MIRGDMGQYTEERNGQRKILARVKDLSIQFTDRGDFRRGCKENKLSHL